LDKSNRKYSTDARAVATSLVDEKWHASEYVGRSNEHYQDRRQPTGQQVSNTQASASSQSKRKAAKAPMLAGTLPLKQKHFTKIRRDT